MVVSSFAFKIDEKYSILIVDTSVFFKKYILKSFKIIENIF